jgi:hypothetical protein
MEKLDKNKTSKKSVGWTEVFIIFIICFPILIEYGNYYFTHGTAIFSFSSILPKLFSIFKNYISFYATALTITFTVYSFTVQQRRIDEEREKKEEERNSNREQQEKDREEELRRERRKELELRIKELEAKRDFYRPTFIVEQNYRTGYDEVKLLMRDENLYLENIRYYENDGGPRARIANLKSGSILVSKNKSAKSFYVTGETQIGEQILFGYLNGGIKIHKYLKSGESALTPGGGFNYYNQDKVEATWGTYNTDGRLDKGLEQVFFYNTIGIRERLVFTYYQSVKSSLQADSATGFFRNIFRGINEEYWNFSLNFDSVHRVVCYFLMEVQVNQTDFKVDTQKINFEYLHHKLKILNENVQEFSGIFTSDDFNLFEFIKKALETLSLIKNITSQTIGNEHDEREMIEKYDNLLRIITQVFDNVMVSPESPLNNKLLIYKAYLFNNLDWS